MSKKKDPKPLRPPQKQDHRPGTEDEMKPRAQHKRPEYKAAGKLEGKAALITGGDSGIGRAVFRALVLRARLHLVFGAGSMMLLLRRPKGLGVFLLGHDVLRVPSRIARGDDKMSAGATARVAAAI